MCDIKSRLAKLQNKTVSVTNVGEVNFTCVFENFESNLDEFLFKFGLADEEGLTYYINIKDIQSIMSNMNQITIVLRHSTIIFENF